MKRIYMALALVGALATGSYAQKNVDLKIRMMSPSGTLPNVAAGDSIRMSFEITNLGPDAVTMSDTTKIWMDTKIFGTAVADVQEAVRLNMPQLDMPVGFVDTLGIWVKQGEDFFSGDPNPINFPADSKNCTFMAVFGYSADGFYFVDPGFDGAVYNAATDLAGLLAAFTGNNRGKSDVQFGSGATGSFCNTTGIDFVSNTEKTSLTVYPNPATDNINFEFSLDKTSPVTVRVADVTGRTVLTKDLGKVSQGSQKVSLDVSSLKSGVYMIELNSDGRRAISKFNVK
jgi:hypothetical protein